MVITSEQESGGGAVPGTDSGMTRRKAVLGVGGMLAGSMLPSLAECAASAASQAALTAAPAGPKTLVYLSAKQDLPFWQSIGKGVRAVAIANGYSYFEMDSRLSFDVQAQNTHAALARGVAGIVVSPVDSQSAPDVLAIARKAKAPVAIADIGTTGGDYLTYVKSDNYRGGFQLGSELAQAMKERGWQNGGFALVTISLARKNGLDRTNGFRDAMKEAGVGQEVALRQMQDYSEQETWRFVKEILESSANLHGLFIETDQPVRGALRALKEAHRSNEVLMVSFDAMPEVADLLKNKSLVAVGMQQPYLMGRRAAEALLANLAHAEVAKQMLVPILLGTGKNIEQLLPQVRQTVFGQE